MHASVLLSVCLNYSVRTSVCEGNRKEGGRKEGKEGGRERERGKEIEIERGKGDKRENKTK